MIGVNLPELSLADQLGRVERVGIELTNKLAPLLSQGSSLSHTDFFILGAVRRTLAQSKGFCDLVSARNLPCAAAILRMQIDTAMRVNALFLVVDADELCKAVLHGERFSHFKDKDGNVLSDRWIRKTLAEKEVWVDLAYEKASDFVHLSGTHFYSAVASTKAEERLAYFQLSAADPAMPESAYYDIVNTFFEATNLACGLLLAHFLARNQALSDTLAYRTVEQLGP